jgi:hypothetical protein
VACFVLDDDVAWVSDQLTGASIATCVAEFALVLPLRNPGLKRFFEFARCQALAVLDTVVNGFKVLNGVRRPECLGHLADLPKCARVSAT